jgi:hypothetical protein
MLFYVVDLQTVKLHPKNLVASLVIDLATGEGHGHAALAADETQLGLSLRGQSLFHSIHLLKDQLEQGEYKVSR